MTRKTITRITAGGIGIYLVLLTVHLCGQILPPNVARSRKRRMVGPAVYGETYSGLYSPLPKETGNRETVADTLQLRNGDTVSGTIEQISEGVATLRSELLSDRVRIALKNIDEIVFRDTQIDALRRQGKAFFVNGDFLSVDVTGYDGALLTATTDFEPERQIERRHILGIVFERDARVMYRADFEDGGSAGFKSTSGEWTASRGTLGPSEETEWTGAYLKLRQEGRVRYRWTQSEEDNRGTEAWFSFFAGHFDHYAPGEAYQVRSSPFRVTLYRTIQNNAQHVATFGLRTRKNTRRFEVEYDSRTGMFLLKVDGEELTTGIFGSPIPRGEYVVLGAQAKHRFDDIVIEQVGEAVLPERGDAADARDCILLVNGDRLSGKVIALSDGKTQIETGYSREVTEAPLQEISAVRFGQMGGVQGSGAGGQGSGGEGEGGESAQLPVVFFRNGDRLSGEVVAYTGGFLRLRSPCIGELELDAKRVSSIDLGRSENENAPVPQSIGWEGVVWDL